MKEPRLALSHVALKPALLTSLVVSAGLVLLVPRAWPLWVTALIALVPWVPLFVRGAGWNYRRHHWMVLFYVLVVTQTAHFFEHVAQMIQIHVLGLQGAAASGIFGALNIETVHFAWNTWVLLASIVLLPRFRENAWLWFVTFAAGWHGVEHAFIFWNYLHTNVPGSPGLLALGGAIRGGLPIARADLHFLYNLVETVPLLIAFFWQSSRAGMPTRATRPRALPAYLVPASAAGLVSIVIAASFANPVKKVLTPDGELVCDKFYSLVQDVRAQSIPVSDIRNTIDQIEAATPRADYNLQPEIPRFVQAAREAVASFYTYPTFDLMAFSETYAHMDAHAHTAEEVKALAKACAADGYSAKPRPSQPTDARLQPPVTSQPIPPAGTVLKDPHDAVAAVQRYLDQKPWGYFGATCAAWASMHYVPDRADVVYAANEDAWVVDIPRQPTALGPSVIRYHVNARSGATHGDAGNNVNSQFAEGCDQY